MTTDSLAEILGKLGEVGVRCPEFRFGQLIAVIGTLAEDDAQEGAEQSLWEIDDTDFLAALNRFAADVANSRGRIAGPNIAPPPASIVSQPPRQAS